MLFQCSDLAGNRDVGEVAVDGFDYLVVVTSNALKLEVKVVESCQKLHLRRVAADNLETLGKESFDDEPAAVVFQSGGSKQLPEADHLFLVEPERVFVTRGRDLGVAFSLTGHSMEDLGFDLGEPHPPRRARTFVGQTAGCRTKVHLAPVRRRVQFRHSQRTIPLLKKQLRNEKSRADSPLQYYEDLQGLKSVLVGHARPPKDIGNQPPKTALPCRQTSNNPSMKLLLYLFFDPVFQDFGNSFRHLFLHDEMLPFVRAGPYS